MSLITTWPYTLTNGQTADATQVMADFNALNNSSMQQIQTIAALRTTTAGSNNQVIQLTGYYNASDGIGIGPFAWYPLSTIADDGGYSIQVTGVGTGRWIRQFIGDPYVNMWGADPTGANASDTAFANAFAYCSANKIGTLRMMSGTGYTSASTILHTVPVKVVADGYGMDTPFNQFGKNVSNTCITCTSGHAATPAIHMYSPSISSGNTLDGAGWLGIQIFGNYAGATPATIGIEGSCINFCDFDVVCSFFTQAGMQLDCIGGTKNCAYNHIKRLVYRPGDSTGYPHTYTSDALHLYQEGTSSAVGCSLNVVDYVDYWPDVGATGGVVVGGDHNLLNAVLANIIFVNAGYNLGWNNRVTYCGGGIVSDTGTYGNDCFVPATNLTGGITGPGQIHYEVIDDANSGRFHTPGYPMYDVLTLTPWQFYNVSGTVTQINATIFRGIEFPTTGGTITSTVPAPFNWNNGYIIGINIFWAASAAATGTVTFAVNVFSDPPGTTITSGGTQSKTIASTSYTVAESVITKLTLSPQTSHTLGNALRIVVQRGTDTYTGNVIITGVQVVYQSIGPHSATAGPFSYNGMGT